MHVLIVCVGSAGDVHPFMAIGQALLRRGHRVTLMTSPYFQDRVLRAGLCFAALGTLADYEATVSDPDLWHPRRGFEVIWRVMRQQLAPGYRAVLKLVDDETVIVASTLAWSARLVRETHGVPMASVHLSPACLLSAQAPPRLSGLGWLARMPVWFNRAVLGGGEHGVLDRLVRPDLDPLRASLRLPPVSRVFGQWMHSPDCVLGAFPDWYAAPQGDWPPRSQCTHFPILAAPDGAVLDPMLARFIQSGPPPIAFTPGSAMAHGRVFFERAIAASQALGRRALLITPWRDQLPAQLPPHVRHVSYVPFDLLAPKVVAFVHHGGIGTVAQCLAAAVPQLLVPMAHDQFDNAARISRLGVGLQVSTRDADAVWAARLMQLLQSHQVKQACMAAAERMAASTVSPALLAHIEALHANRPGTAD